MLDVTIILAVHPSGSYYMRLLEVAEALPDILGAGIRLAEVSVTPEIVEKFPGKDAQAEEIGNAYRARGVEFHVGSSVFNLYRDAADRPIRVNVEIQDSGASARQGTLGEHALSEDRIHATAVDHGLPGSRMAWIMDEMGTFEPLHWQMLQNRHDTAERVAALTSSPLLGAFVDLWKRLPSPVVDGGGFSVRLRQRHLWIRKGTWPETHRPREEIEPAAEETP